MDVDNKMSADHKMKWVCTFLLMGFLGWWGYFTVNITLDAMANPTSIDVLKASGASGILATVSTLFTLTIQHWFRRSKPQ